MKFKQSIILAALTVSLTCSNIFAAPIFKDVPSNNWAAPYIEKMYNKKIISGFPDQTFKMNDPVTRLQSLVMIGKIFGESQVDSVYNASKAKYQKNLNDSKIPVWAQKYIVFVVEKDIVGEKMIAALIDSKGKELAVQRFEIPMYLSSAFKFPVDKDKKVFAFDFADQNQIPKLALPYVDYFINNKIISGQNNVKGEKVFAPTENVTRAAMAKMLSLSYDLYSKQNPEKPPVAEPTKPPTTLPDIKEDGSSSSISFYKGVIQSAIEFSGKIEIALKDDLGNIKIYNNFSNEVTIKNSNIPATLANLKSGTVVELKLVGGKLKEIYINSSSNNNVEKGSVEGFINQVYFDLSPSGESITKLRVDTDKKGLMIFEIPKDVSLRVNGQKREFKEVYNIKSNDKIMLEYKGNIATSMEVLSKEDKIKGSIYKLSSDEDYITIEDKNKDTQKYKVQKRPKIEKNGKEVDFKDLRVGDEIDLYLEYSQAYKLIAYSVKSKQEGKIIELNMSQNPYVVLETSDSNKETYKFANSFEVDIEGKDSKIYDLRLGYKAKVELDGDLIKRIKVSDVDDVDVKNITGEVVDIDTKENIIELKRDSDRQKIQVKYSNNTDFESYTGKRLDEYDIDKEDRISVIGVDQLGNLKADRIIRLR